MHIPNLQTIYSSHHIVSSWICARSELYESCHKHQTIDKDIDRFINSSSIILIICDTFLLGHILTQHRLTVGQCKGKHNRIPIGSIGYSNTKYVHSRTEYNTYFRNKLIFSTSDFFLGVEIFRESDLVRRRSVDRYNYSYSCDTLVFFLIFCVLQ